ncbi:hypothetical protein M426DRAFT_18515 [Hypoxylon sp. CI-4A]|nr:hypothetical protein M426DRAFT_18515 [Hypoxylon sp. CI-4A]
MYSGGGAAVAKLRDAYVPGCHRWASVAQGSACKRRAWRFLVWVLGYVRRMLRFSGISHWDTAASFGFLQAPPLKSPAPVLHEWVTCVPAEKLRRDVASLPWSASASNRACSRGSRELLLKWSTVGMGISTIRYAAWWNYGVSSSCINGRYLAGFQLPGKEILICFCLSNGFSMTDW